MNFIQLRDMLVNLDTVRYIELDKRKLIFYYGGTEEIKVIYENEEDARTTYTSLWVFIIRTQNVPLAQTK